jgi:PGF-CTERM protein
MRDTILPTILALLLATSAIGAAIAFPVAADGTYEDGYYANNDYYDSNEYTETIQSAFYGIPNDSHEPGNTEATFHSYTVPGEKIDEPFNVHYYSYRTTLPTANCGTGDIVGAGIDRGNNRTGTTTDISLVNAFQNQRFTTNNESADEEPPMQPRGERVAPDGWDHREKLTFEFAQESDGALASDPVRINPDDEVILGLKDCNDFPNVEGWYRAWIFVNGTGVESGEEVEFFAFTNWVYICSDCESRADAREKFGPPGGDGPGSTATPETTATPESTTTPQTTTATPDPTTPQTTATPEPTDAATPDPTATSQTTATPEPAGTATSKSTAGIGPTPTSGGGPGFGVGLAVVALLISAALRTRRN